MSSDAPSAHSPPTAAIGNLNPWSAVCHHSRASHARPASPAGANDVPDGSRSRLLGAASWIALAGLAACRASSGNDEPGAAPSAASTVPSTMVAPVEQSAGPRRGNASPDLRTRGPYRVQIDPGSVQVGGCTMPYDIVTPVDVPAARTVILAHGFQGKRGSMLGWAEHWASWGLRVVTPDLCHATILDADHARNGADLASLAAHLDVGPVALAGYSAGGLAAVIAAAARPDTPVLLGFDMVDANGLGAKASPGVTAPAHDITAEPAGCNASGNGVPVFAAIERSIAVRIVEGDHCDFQNPGDNFCGLCAAANGGNSPEAIQAAIYGLSTAALLWRLGLDDTGSQWWMPGGAYYDQMVLAGVIAIHPLARP